MVELTTQLLILENILWLPLCRINKFGLNTLPSKTVAIPYTCGLSCAPTAYGCLVGLLASSPSLVGFFWSKKNHRKVLFRLDSV